MAPPASQYSIISPSINLDLLPPGERDAAWNLNSSINGLAAYVSDFQAALELFDFSQFFRRRNFVNQQFSKWQFLAARDGAMTMYHFSRVLIHSGKSFRECPSLLDLIDRSLLREPRRRFETQFPNVVRVRHSVAHTAEMTETTKARDGNAFSGSIDRAPLIKAENVKGLMITNSLSNREFTTTYEGDIISYEISSATLDTLSSIAREFYQAFEPVDTMSAATRELLAKYR